MSLESLTGHVRQMERLSDKQEQILIVDDDPFILAALEMTLKREGLIVHKAESGKEAIAILKNHPIAVLICDQKLPGMSGNEILKISQEISPETMRIILTGHNDLETTIEAINIGKVAQFIAKPWEDATLRQAIQSSLDKYRLIKENQRLEGLNLQQHIELEKTHAQLRHELLLGGRIYETLLLETPPKLIPGLSIEALTIPSREIDGDFFEFYHPIPPVFDIIFGDVMGKGLPAALVGTAVKTELARFSVPFAPNKFIGPEGTWQEDLFSPEEILMLIHKDLVPKLLHLEYFVSLFYGRFDLQRRTFNYLDCGSTKPLYYSSQKKRLKFLSGTNFPLGISEICAYTSHSLSFDEGDFFIFYSDGVTEARSPDNQLFGLKRLSDVIEQNLMGDPQQMLHAIRHAVLEFTEKESCDDDLTVIAVKILQYCPPIDANILSAKFSSDLSQLKAVRQFVSRLCEKAPGDSTLLSNQLHLAINEIFCNIVVHGYNNEPGPVEIQARFLDDGIALTIADQGQLFDPTILQEPSLAGDQEGGFGWHIIRAIADELGYSPKRSEKGWNQLYFFKRYIVRGEEMQLESKMEEGVLVIRPKIESLDAKESREFKQKVSDLVTADAISKVVLDLEEIKYVDSSGLGGLLSILKLLHSKGGDLKLTRMNKPVRTIFELVSMHKIFEIYNSPQEAIRSFV